MPFFNPNICMEAQVYYALKQIHPRPLFLFGVKGQDEILGMGQI